jgi:lipoate-protein ligase A
MTTRLIRSASHNPHHNLALEQYLMDIAEPAEVILYLWQNGKSVVIGRNQNPWAECRVGDMRQNGVALARRSSGGGAVYHDLGNLNFTFIAHEPWYDAEKQTDIVLGAVRSLGLEAVKTGRNDLTIDGFKFSGHAFTSRDGRCCHHGTLMVGVDTGALERFLNVPADKLTAKGVKSVRARVRNLSDFDPAITVDRVSAALIGAFAHAYAEPRIWTPGAEDEAGIRPYHERYAGDDWVLGQTFAFDNEIERRFPWGGVTVQFKIAGGAVEQARVFSDALDAELASRLEGALSGVRYAAADLAAAVRGVSGDAADWLAGQEGI